MMENALPEREFLTIDEIAKWQDISVEAVLDYAVDGARQVFAEVQGTLLYVTTDDDERLPDDWQMLVDEDRSWEGYALVEQSDLKAFRRGESPECKHLRIPDLPNHDVFVVNDDGGLSRERLRCHWFSPFAPYCNSKRGECLSYVGREGREIIGDYFGELFAGEKTACLGLEIVGILYIRPNSTEVT